MTTNTTPPRSTEVSAADVRVAWELCIELTTRITTQPLPFRDGDEATALKSVADFFKSTRATLAKTPGCTVCAALVLGVLNRDIRPFTAKWHRKQTTGQMHSADDRYIFRAELADIQNKLVLLAENLATLAGMPMPWIAPQNTTSESDEKDIGFLQFGILEPYTMSNDAIYSQKFNQINKAEWGEISKRRLELKLDTDTDRKNAIGLALSGGGIRSATFSLGVIQQLVQRNLLKDVDFMSTVSGGGYLGSFISTHGIDSLNPEGVSSDSPAVRKLRNHSKYLTEGGIRTWAEVGFMLLHSIFTSLVLLSTTLLIVWLAVSELYILTSCFQAVLWLSASSLCLVMLIHMTHPTRQQEKELRQFGAVFLATVVVLLLILALLNVQIDEIANLIFKNISTATKIGLGGVLLAMAWWVEPNSAGLHRYYRDRLARAFLQDRKGVLLSDLNTLNESRNNTKCIAPYHLINTTLNIPDSSNEELRGRDSDVFILSKHYCGSNLTGWRETKPFGLTIATAMAISGAAASTHMGTQSRWHYRIPLGIFGLRLGYWLPWPKNDSTPPSWIGAGWLCFLRELTGWRMDENQSHLNLSDGGHIENLGIYELLRRRCRYIIAIDGECDPQHHFGGLLTLIRMAKIDMGIHIEPELADLRPNPQGLCDGHFTLARIYYPKQNDTEPYGLLLYIKLSMTGDEPELLKSFRRENPDFPHQSTAQQLFSEAQFEAYRSLGEHIGEKLFAKYLIKNKTISSIGEWMEQLHRSLIQ